MFGRVAPRYDLLNHLLSFNIDRGWRKALLESMRHILERPRAKVLDLCCGTGDVLLEVQSATQNPMIGADFCHPMLVSAVRKIGERNAPSKVIEADALQLPLRDAALDGICIAFGFRNLANYEAALHELWRVLKPGGTLAILEFSHPRGLFVRTAYEFYSRFVLPAVGGLISGS